MSNSERFMMVPVRVDALVVKGTQGVAVRRAPDYTRLPYHDQLRRSDVNADTAFLAETIVQQPFASASVQLGHGVHLHWAMPDALTHGHYDPNADAIVFPQLPTRWLVTRRFRDGQQPEQRWIIESDYLAPPGINRRRVAIDIPWKDDTSDQPYRYLGRSMPLQAWHGMKIVGNTAEYLPSLTALGFGDLGFAAYYPSCFSVFGFHDPEPPVDLTQIEYLVAGWYPDTSRDPLHRLSIESDNEYGLALIHERFGWTLDEAVSRESVPTAIVCHASIDFKPESVKREAAVASAPLEVTVADTPGEALSAWLARTMVQRGGSTVRGDAAELRARIEEQLEALQLGADLDESSLGLATEVRALRHRTRFNPVQGGSAWRIRVDTHSEVQEPSSANASTPLPVALAAVLSRVNRLQREYDQGSRRVQSLQSRVYADWYKYMVTLYPPDSVGVRYPDSDRIRLQMSRDTARALADQLAATGRLEIDSATRRPLLLDGDASSSAGRLVDALQQLQAALEEYHHSLKEPERSRQSFVIESMPGTRFYQASNPVVMICGDAARRTERHGQDGVMRCGVYQGSMNNIPDIDTLVTSIEHHLADNDAGRNSWTEQPWNPVMLDWKVQLYSVEDHAQRFIGSEAYSPGYIADNYEAPVLTPELQLRPGRGKLVRDPSVYIGTTILTDQATTLLRDAIQQRLLEKSQAIAKFFRQKAIEAVDERLAFLADPEKVGMLLAWFRDPDLGDPTVTMVTALHHLLDTSALSQELGGFNPALIMQKDTIELPVDDPVNFSSYRQFTAQFIQPLLAGAERLAPSPQNAFNPIRAGSLKMMALKLVDTFGQVRDVDLDAIGTSTATTTVGAEHLVRLPPRLTQPACLNFRWLAASDAVSQKSASADTKIDSSIIPGSDAGAADSALPSESASSVESTSEAGPICGWLLPNLLDRSIAFHNASGESLGYFKAGKWRDTPDSDAAVDIDGIGNPYLQRIARFVESSIDTEGDSFIETFIGVLDDALDNIVVDDARTSLGAGLLMGRPIAVVRAIIDLELLGSPAVNHSWGTFERDLERLTRNTADFTRVRFPVRIGEYGQLNDGLVGYWLEQRADDGGVTFAGSGGLAVFYSPQSDYIDTPVIETRYQAHKDGAINFHQSIDDEPQILTLLMDPRCRLHATVGVVPRKVIDIPEEQYAHALENIEVGFLHAPLLTPVGKLELPLQPMPGFEWSWVEQRSDGWHELHPLKRLRQKDVIQGWNTMMLPSDAPVANSQADGAALWHHLLDATVSWIEPLTVRAEGSDNDVEYVLVASEDENRSALLNEPFAGREAIILELLDRVGVGIDPVSTHARFGTANELREGWLKLRRAPLVVTATNDTDPEE